MQYQGNNRNFFTSLRDLVTRGMQSVVHTANRGLPQQGQENLHLDSVPCVPHEPGGRRTVGEKGIALIKQFEGCARLRTDRMVEAYPDPGTGSDPWTIGWGATGRDNFNGGRIGPGTLWSRQQCDERLERDLVHYAHEVADALGSAPTSQNQFDAMVSFHYNTGAIARATLTRRHIAGDFTAACGEFARWNKAGGRVLKGLTRRRAEEARLYASS